MRLHHFFDWSAFAFAVRTIAFLAIIGVGGNFVLRYADDSTPLAPSLVLIQEARPAAGKSLALSLSTTTSMHIINTLAVADAVPPVGKLIAVDLSTMVLTLYQDAVAVAKYPILAKGEAGSPEETPAGFYAVVAKESDRLDAKEHIDFPWSVQFYGNHFIHGWPLSANGAPVVSSSGGGIRLSTEDAARVYAFTEMGTGIFVYRPRTIPSSLVLDAVPLPEVSAESYLVADIDTGDVFLEQNAGEVFPLASLTKLVAALTANETIPFDTKITLPRDSLLATKKEETFFAGDLLYPLLMQSNNTVAVTLAQSYGAERFVDWMNSAAKALDMPLTRFSDASGTETRNVSTANDLFHLAAYLADGKSFILDILGAPSVSLIAASGAVYQVRAPTSARNALLSVSTLPLNGGERRVAIIVLGSKDAVADATALSEWFAQSARQGADLAGTACITCAIVPPYRKIQR